MRKFGFSFSWRRALGLSSAKGKISRAIGIPLTQSGRQQKAGRLFGDLANTALIDGTQVLQASGAAPSDAPSQDAKDEVQAAGQGLRGQISSGEGFSSESLIGSSLLQRGGHQCRQCGLVYGAGTKYCGKCGPPFSLLT
jgi:hypothetical protein